MPVEAQREVVVVERPERPVRVGIAALADRVGALAVERPDVVVRGPRSGFVLVLQPVRDDGRSPDEWIRPRLIAILGLLGEQVADGLLLIARPRRDVAVEPDLHVL